MRAFQDELEQLRAAHAPTVSGWGSQDIIAAATNMLAFVNLKFQWVHEPPYTVWQLDSPSMAQEFLRNHDTLIAAGRIPHRVVAHFAAAGSPLRSDLEQHAEGKGMSTQLRREVTAYQLCTLYDTWVEAAHRDISHLSKQKSNSRMALRLATVRLKHNLDFFHSVADSTKDIFQRILWPNWKAIARQPTLRDPKKL